MNNGFAGRRVSHFATRAHIGLEYNLPKTQNPLHFGSGSTETYNRSISPECHDERVRSRNNTGTHNNRSSA